MELSSEERIKRAITLMAGGKAIEEFRESDGNRGRPTIKYRIGDVVLNKYEYGEVINAKPHLVMTDEEFAVMARSAVPALTARAVKLGLESNRVDEVVKVLGLLADRGYGKAVQSLAVVDARKDVRETWRRLENYKPLDMIESEINNDGVETTGEQ